VCIKGLTIVKSVLVILPHSNGLYLKLQESQIKAYSLLACVHKGPNHCQICFSYTSTVVPHSNELYLSLQKSQIKGYTLLASMILILFAIAQE